MANVEFDASNLLSGLARWTSKMSSTQGVALEMIGDELIRLSVQQIPHDDGLLQNSAEAEPVSNDEVLVGFNKEYAAYQHEGSWPDGSHVVRNHSKPGRKTHYLSDPLKANLSRFEKVFGETIASRAMS